jgi:hypothetical protein
MPFYWSMSAFALCLDICETESIENASKLIDKAKTDGFVLSIKKEYPYLAFS